MPIIVLKTSINASLEKCFDLSRSIDLHMESMKSSDEKAINGRLTGLIELGEQVTWQAKHFGLSFKMTSQITAMAKPAYFIDEMINGPFKKLHHKHQFISLNSQTEMTDIFEFESPFYLLGWLADFLFLKCYMRKLLTQRNNMIKLIAEQP